MCSDKKHLFTSMHMIKVPLSCRTKGLFNPASAPTDRRSVKPP